MTLLGSTKNLIATVKNGENVSHLEITEILSIPYNIVNNDYQQGSRVLYTFVPNKPFGNLLEIYPTNHIFLKALNLEFHDIAVWFTYQNSQQLETKERINLT